MLVVLSCNTREVLVKLYRDVCLAFLRVCRFFFSISVLLVELNCLAYILLPGAETPAVGQQLH